METNHIVPLPQIFPLPIDVGYWITTCLVIALCFLVRPYLDNYLNWSRFRYWLFQWLNERNWRRLEPRYVKVVLVEDEEYWKGPPAGRRPIKRSYLAQLVRALTDADAATIVLDFDLRLPDPNSVVIPTDYKAETDKLIDEIVAAAEKRHVVLPKTIWSDGNGGYKVDPDIYVPYGVCSQFEEDGRWSSPGTQDRPISESAREHIRCGYIALSEDRREVPGRLRLTTNHYLDSFALAIAKTNRPGYVLPDDKVVYGSYIPMANFRPGEAIFSAHDLLVNPGVRSSLAHKTVIVGANWSMLAYGRGGKVDRHATPVGALSGALIHANFVEALLDERRFTGLPDWMIHSLEIIFALLAAYIFSQYPEFLSKLVAMAALSGGLVAITFLALQLFGVFFDGGLLLLALWLHAVIEHAIGS